MLLENRLELPKPKYDYITTEEAAHSAMSDISRYPVIGVDTEGTGLDPYTSRVVLVQISTLDKAYVFDVRHDTPHSSLHLDTLKPILIGDQLKILQNATYDMKMIKVRCGFYIKNIYDTMLVEQLLHLGIPGKASLDYLVKKYLGISMDKQPRSTFADYNQVLQPFQLEYAANDPLVLHDIRNAQLPQIKEHGFENVCNLEFAFTKPLCEMELNGMCLDVPKWRAIMSGASVEMERTAAEISSLLAPLEDQTTLFGASVVDINSPLQLKHALMKYGLELESTNEAELTKHKGLPLIDSILEYRKYSKLISTYAETLIEKINKVTGRLHTEFKQMVATGRMSSSNPNLQNIPKKQKYRSCFIAPSGRRLITADMSGAELRILGNLSQDPIFIESYAHGIDLHTRTAAETFGVSMGKVTKSMREAAKALNFGLCTTEDTNIITDSGIKYIKNALLDDLVAHDLGTNRIIDKKFMGEKEVFEIQSQFGYKIEVTSDHLVKVIDKKGEYVDKALKDVDIDTDLICLRFGSCLFPVQDFVFDDFSTERHTNYIHFNLPKKVDDKWAAFLGLFVSEGSIGKVKGREKYSVLQFGFSDNEPEFIEKIDSLLSSLFGDRLTRIHKNGVVKYTFNSVLFCEWLALICNIKMVDKTCEINIPDCIKQSSRKIQIEFLKWLFEGDGSVKQNGKGYSITYSSKSYNLMKDLQLVLLNFGVLSSIRNERRSDYPEEIYYELKIISVSQEKFLKDIGFVTLQKTNKCRSHVKYNMSSYFIGKHPKRVKKVIDLIKQKEIKIQEDNQLISRFYKKRLTDSVGSVYLKTLSKYDSFFNFIYENNIVPLPIKSIESKGVKKVYDLSVENHEYFLANGFVVHNCYGLSKFGLARRLKISEKEADDIINNYFARYKYVKKYLDESAKSAILKRYSTTVSGRKRFYKLPPYSDPNFKRIRAGIERQAKNAGIQGANADTIKQSMVYLVERLEKDGYNAKLISTVHDEVIVESTEEQAREVGEVVVKSLVDGFGHYFHLIPMESQALLGPCWLKGACEIEDANGKKCGGTEMKAIPSNDEYGTKIVCKKCGGTI